MLLGGGLGCCLFCLGGGNVNRTEKYTALKWHLFTTLGKHIMNSQLSRDYHWI